MSSNPPSLDDVYKALNSEKDQNLGRLVEGLTNAEDPFVKTLTLLMCINNYLMPYDMVEDLAKLFAQSYYSSHPDGIERRSAINYRKSSYVSRAITLYKDKIYI